MVPMLGIFVERLPVIVERPLIFVERLPTYIVKKLENPVFRALRLAVLWKMPTASNLPTGMWITGRRLMPSLPPLGFTCSIVLSQIFPDFGGFNISSYTNLPKAYIQDIYMLFRR